MSDGRGAAVSGAYAFAAPVALLALAKRSKARVAPTALGLAALTMIVVNGRIFADRPTDRA
jgi:ATP-dependent protease HslVU (ClpYQ) peptidase subunit